MNPLEALLDRWREEAAILRRRGATGRADLVESLAAELEDAWAAYWRVELSVERAAEESGYSPAYLRDLVRKGKIPDARPDGSQGRIRIRREHLPRKPGSVDEEPDPDVRDLFERVR